ncbi:unnamed protein product [Urochloa decumbens]|uniref:Uncharacterized protein n=1 Tax=Urochloa decumbens TaxID=240449 RepID=A0ABC9DMX7_9POAL
MARMAAAKLRAAVVALLLATSLLVVLADAGRPLKEEPSSWSSEGDDTVAVVESPASDIQTVVGAAEHDGAGGSRDDGRAFMSIDMLGGIKDSGPSPGAGH